MTKRLAKHPSMHTTDIVKSTPQTDKQMCASTNTQSYSTIVLHKPKKCYFMIRLALTL